MIESLVKLSSHNMVALRKWNYGVIYSCIWIYILVAINSAAPCLYSSHCATLQPNDNTYSYGGMVVRSI